MKNYEEISSLGDGAFGIVTKMKSKINDQLVAVKKMKQKTHSFSECLEMKEVKSLRKIKHDNIIKLIEIVRENEILYLIFELCDKGLLPFITNKDFPLTEPIIKDIVYQLLSGIDSVHRAGFFHRDLKPENIMFVEDTLKIVDFGLAREIRSRPPYTNYIGTRYYRAPEILLHHEFYNTPVDIWAIGAITAELFLRKPLFPGTSETDQLFKITSILGPITESNYPEGFQLARKMGLRFPSNIGNNLENIITNASPEAINFIKQCLKLNPHKRPSAKNALNHPFLQGERISISGQSIFSNNNLLIDNDLIEEKFERIITLDKTPKIVKTSGSFSHLDTFISSPKGSRPVNYDQFSSNLDVDDIFNNID